MNKLSLQEMDILGFFDEDEDKIMDAARNQDPYGIDLYEEAYKQAIERAKEEGVWQELIDNNDPEDVLIELQTYYSDLFEF